MSSAPAVAGTLDWFALTVTSQHEKTVSQALDQKGFEVLLPYWRARRQWSDRIKEVELPLFPGYVLCRFDGTRRAPILQTPGVRSIVGFGNGPTALGAEEVASLKTLMASGRPLEPWTFQPDRPVRLTAGPFRGCTGTVIKALGCWRLVVSLELLRRAVAVEIDPDAAELPL